MSPSPKGQRPPQQAVRVGKFEQAMEAFNLEMSQKMTRSLYRYHLDFIQPVEERMKLLERRLIMRIGGFLILMLVDWRIAAGALFLAWPSFNVQFGRAFMDLFVKAWILVTWEVSDEKISEGWEPRWYQGLARRLDTLDGFIYHLKPLHILIRLWDSWERVRKERKIRENLLPEEESPSVTEEETESGLIVLRGGQDG